MLALWEVDFLLSVIWLMNNGHEHPSLGGDDSESSIYLFVQAEEVVKLLVSILKAFSVKLSISNLENSVIKLELINTDEAQVCCLFFIWV